MQGWVWGGSMYATLPLYLNIKGYFQDLNP